MIDWLLHDWQEDADKMNWLDVYNDAMCGYTCVKKKLPEWIKCNKSVYSASIWILANI